MAVEMDVATVSTIINNINSLYGNLVSYTVGLILFVGAFVPGVISFFQRRQFTREYEELNKRVGMDIAERVREAEKALTEAIGTVQQDEFKKIEELNSALKNELTKELRVLKGNAFHLQAQREEFPKLCLASCECALACYLEGEDEQNARSILNIIGVSMDKIGKGNAEDFEDIEQDVVSILDTLKRHDDTGRYAHDIENIKKKLRVAKAKVNSASQNLPIVVAPPADKID